MNREIFVYADLNGESHLVGTLWTRLVTEIMQFFS